MSNQVYIVSGCRTAIGSFQGQYKSIPATELGSIVISEALKRANLQPDDVNEVIMGHILTAGQGQNPARQAAVGAKIPYSVPAYTINMLCGSGLKSIFLAYQSIRNDDSEIIVAGGQENMSRAEHSAYIRGTKLGTIEYKDTLLSDGLTDAFFNVPMGNTAEHLAKEYIIPREVQDEFAFSSQTKAKEAIQNDYFKNEIVPVVDKRSNKLIVSDEHPKFDTNITSLAQLKPAFVKNGSVTAGNASGINDGAAAVILANDRQIKLKNLKPLAKIVAFSQVALDPMQMGLGPIEAIKKVLQKANWDINNDVDLYEINEAFAVQSIIICDKLGLNPNKVNVCGGAIALGHPIGASGARVVVTLIYNLKRLNKKQGIASLCIGGGMGIAIAIELC